MRSYRAHRRKSLNKAERTMQIYRRVVAVVVLIVVLVAVFSLYQGMHKRTGQTTLANAQDIVATKYIADRPELDVELLPINQYSRPGTELTEVKGIVVHYTANPGSTAKQNRDYFAGLAESHETSASSHFVIGLEGEIVQCIPCNEISYASNDRNKDTISIECCIEDESGKFNDATYQSLIKLVTWLMGRYNLGTDDVIRHYDVTGKNCPKYFVENPDAWELFKTDLVDYIAKYGIAKDA